MYRKSFEYWQYSAKFFFYEGLAKMQHDLSPFTRIAVDSYAAVNSPGKVTDQVQSQAGLDANSGGIIV